MHRPVDTRPADPPQNCPAGTDVGKSVAIERHRRAIDDSFGTAQNEVGLGRDETRSRHGWYRRCSLAMLAFGMVAAIRHRPTFRRPEKRCAGRRYPLVVRDPVVGSAHPPDRRRICPKTPAAWSCHRMVDVATRASGRRPEV
jgi:SRSO17 transposase